MDLLTMLGVGLAGVITLFWVFARMRIRRQDAPTTRSGGRHSRNSRGQPRSMEHLDTVTSWQPQATRVLTSAERKMFNSLRLSLPDHLVLAQVPLARFLKVPTRYSYAEWLRRVGLMCADIVVCDSSSQVIAVVDIRVPLAQENDRTRIRNARMDRVLHSAEIPIHVWREDALPNGTVARNTVLQLPLDTPMEGARPEVAAPASRGPGTATGAGADAARDTSRDPPTDDDLVDRGEPPPSTWFDDLDTHPLPLDPAKANGLRPPAR